MSASVDDIGDEGLGERRDTRFKEIATAAAKALIEDDPRLERWVTPLVRAIRRGRLRLPSLSPTVHRVVKLIEAPEVDLDELADAVNGDPVLATRIMGVANSSYFRGVNEVPNVRDALMRMGVREARTIVVVVALRSTLLRSPGLGETAHQLWGHALLTASATQEIAQEVPPWETAGFLAGLLHDLGQLVVLAFVSELPAWQEDGSEPSPEVVQSIISGVHSALGAMVLASWDFPDAFCQAILDHHASVGDDWAPSEADDASTLAVSIRIGHLIAHQIDEGWPDTPEELPELLIDLASRLGVSDDRLMDVAAESAANVAALSKLG